MARQYRMRKRAEVRDRTRERIVQATMELHDVHGVATTTYSDIAERAGVGPATVYRHFPEMGDLVRACGAHVWEETKPPRAETAAAVFSGLDTTPARLRRLFEELDAFYARGAHRLDFASRDRHRVPELDAFLKAVESGVEALAREALRFEDPADEIFRLALALSDFYVWVPLCRLDLPRPERVRLWTRLLECGMSSARSRV